MTIAYEPVCHGAEHAPFNAALLATALEAFPGQELAFLAEQSHAAYVRAMLDRATVSAVRWSPIVIAPRSCRRASERFRDEWRVVSEVLNQAAVTGSGRIVACAVTHVGLAALECQLVPRARRAKVAVMHHSGLASTLGSRSTQALLRWTAGGRLRHVVLGKCIRQAVLHHQRRADGVYSLRHPYLFPDVVLAAWPADEPVRFGFLGLATVEKGFDRFCHLASLVSTRWSDPGVRPRFELIGRLVSPAELQALDPEGLVEVGSANGPMPRERYEERVGAITYAVLPYGPHHALASSGAILDAFAHAKPCIALRTPLFEEYFSSMGDIGYLCDNEEELVDVVNRLASSRPGERYVAQRRNIMDRRGIFSPRNVASELRRVLI